MYSRSILVLVSVLLVSALVGCGVEQSAEPATPTGPSSEAPSDPAAGGTRLAVGLYDLEDGTVQGVGTLEYVDLEGGFWALIGGTAAEGTEGETVAVIANGGEFEDQLKALSGRLVMISGKRLEGASIRMAGPEVEITDVQEISDTPGPAE